MSITSIDILELHFLLTILVTFTELHTSPFWIVKGMQEYDDVTGVASRNVMTSRSHAMESCNASLTTTTTIDDVQRLTTSGRKSQQQHDDQSLCVAALSTGSARDRTLLETAPVPGGNEWLEDWKTDDERRRRYAGVIFKSDKSSDVYF